VLYGEGVAERVRAAAGGPVDAVFDVAGKTPVEDLISLAPEPSQVVAIANYAAGQAGARVTGGGRGPLQRSADFISLDLGHATGLRGGNCRDIRLRYALSIYRTPRPAQGRA
jgi:hypothetical protein